MAEGSGQSTTPNQADDIKQRTSNLKNFLEELKHFIRYADRMNVFASYLGYVPMLPASESLALHPIPRSIHADHDGTTEGQVQHINPVATGRQLYLCGWEKMNVYKCFGGTE
jgi:hypothetical protein